MEAHGECALGSRLVFAFRSRQAGEQTPPEELALADWRRRTAEIYGEVRTAADPDDGHARWRAGRDRLFREHAQSPLAPADPLRASGLPYWPYDPRWRVTSPVLSEPEPARYEIQTAPGELTRIRQIVWVELPDPIGGRLAVWWLEQYGGGLFVPFRDATAGTSTYGAGRYLLDTAKGADLGLDGERLVLDFNFSYHPSCRYDPAWQCPLAPPQNVLGVAVEAGERLCE
ncbi:MAG: DUF1684 domain-containing protein [Acidobacteriota bacterium]|nr:DUF1684 domain-containing protein [Acidobacteriota bacterium]